MALARRLARLEGAAAAQHACGASHLAISVTRVDVDGTVHQTSPLPWGSPSHLVNQGRPRAP